MTILEWAKANAKDDANFAELEELVERENPINRVKSVSDAEVFVKENPVFTSYLDSAISKAVDSHDKKFKENKLPDILKDEREKIRAELNPKESDQDKAIRELREQNADLSNSIKRKELITELRAKAKDYLLPDSIVDRIAIFGDESESVLGEVGGYIRETITAGIENGIKERYKGGKAPDAGKENPNAKVVNRDEYFVMSPAAQSEFIAAGGTVEDA